MSERAAIMIVTLTGTNDFLLKKYQKDKIKEYQSNYGEFSVEIIDCEEAESGKITEAIQSLPFLVPQKLVILLSPGKSKNFTENFAEIIERVSDSIELIIVEPKPDKRSVFYKLLKSKTEMLECTDLDANKLVSWLVDQARSGGASLNNADAKYLVERVGQDQLRLENELQKLISYSPKITKESIDVLTVRSSQSSIFDLIEAAVSGDAQRALSLYDEQRQKKVEPIQVIAMLSWQLHILAIIISAGDRSVQQIASDAKLSPFVVSKSQRLAKQFTYKQIKDYINDLQQLDVESKTVSIDIDQALQAYILGMQK